MNMPPKRPDGPDGSGDPLVDQVLDTLVHAPVPDVPDDLMARVLGDAQAMLPPPGGARAPAPWWRQVVSGLGGWTAVGGLVAAAATGFVLGLDGLDTGGFDVIWLLDEGTYDSSTGALDAFGWDYEEG